MPGSGSPIRAFRRRPKFTATSPRTSMTPADGWQIWIRPPESSKRSGCGGAGTRRRAPAMPLSRGASGPWPPRRLRWVKPHYRMSRRRLKQAWTLRFAPHRHERQLKWSRRGRSDRCGARQWFHPLNPKTLPKDGDRRYKMWASIGASPVGGTRRKPHRPVIGSGPPWRPGPGTSRNQSNVRLNFE